MKEYFSSIEQKKFLDYFKAKDNPSDIEKLFYDKANKYIWYIKWVPWIRMIAIGNSISMNSAKKTSDIDLFIITTNNSMWFVRIIITLIFSVLKVRKTENKHAWMFCLSFFVATGWMNFESWKINNDIYLYFWVLYLKPILNYNNTYENFINENKYYWMDIKWYEDLIENNKKYIKYSYNKKNWNWVIIKFLNKIFKFLFLPKTLKHYEKIWKPYWIIINDNILKFHNWDIRQKISNELVS